MGVKDRKANEYFADNRRFADLCNAALFEGRPVILPEALETTDTTEVLSVLGMDEKEISFQKWRDLLKRVIIKKNQNVYLVLIGAELQSDVHYAMPVKDMVYAGLNYGAQVKEAGKRHKKEKEWGTKPEFLSGFHRDDTLTPVITITVYLGAEAWDGPRSLHEMFGTLDEELKQWVPDYRINLLAPREIKDFSVFRTEVGQVLQFIRASESKQEVEELLTRYPEKFSRLDAETVAAICLFTGIEVACEDEKEVVDLCKAWEEHWESGLREGRETGLREGREDGLREGRETGRHEERISSIRNMVELGVPKEKILIKYTLAEYEDAMKQQ